MLSQKLRRKPGALLVLLALLLGVTVLAACSGIVASSAASVRPSIPGGDAARGKANILQYGCGSCHMIPGIENANGLVGPPLIHWAKRGFIAGELQNSPDNLVTWLKDPHAVEPKTDMPNLGLSELQARDIAAYLYTIQ